MKVENKILIIQYIIAFITFIMLIINVNGLFNGFERVKNYEERFTGQAIGVIKGQSTGGRWVHYGIEWFDNFGKLHRGSNELPVTGFGIGDSVKIKFNLSNPNEYLFDIYSEIYHPIQNSVVMLMISISILLFNFYLIYLYYNDRNRFIFFAKKYFRKFMSK